MHISMMRHKSPSPETRLLTARGLVGVRGAGLAFDGLYYVDSVTTTIKRGSCKQSFRLTRNGLVSITPLVPV